MRGEHGPHWDDLRPHLVGIPQLIVESKDEALHLPHGTNHSRNPSFSPPFNGVASTDNPRPQIIQNILDEETAAKDSDAEKGKDTRFESSRRKLTKSLKGRPPIEHKYDYSCGCQNLPMEIANMLTAFVFAKRKSDQVSCITCWTRTQAGDSQHTIQCNPVTFYDRQCPIHGIDGFSSLSFSASSPFSASMIWTNKNS